MPRIGLIRVLTTEDAQLLQTHGRLIMERFPSLQVTSRCIPDHPSGVHNEATERSAARWWRPLRPSSRRKDTMP